MAVRFDDEARTLRLSVLDLVERGAEGGHLRLDVPISAARRLSAGRDIHARWAGERDAEPAFQAEVGLRATLGTGDWQATVFGRADGLTREGEATLVEEVKSSALPADRLLATTAADWPAYVAQVSLYLWLLHEQGAPRPVGRLVFVSLFDGARHVLHVPIDPIAVRSWVQTQIDQIRRDRERRLAWWEARRPWAVPWPYAGQRAGQASLQDSLRDALDDGVPAMVQAPTGWGKTAVTLHAVLSHALRRGKQIYWATARTTQQQVVLDAAERLRREGLALRVTSLSRKDRLCLNDRVSCGPDQCRFAAGYWERHHRHDAGWTVAEAGGGQLGTLRAHGERWQICPHALGVEVAQRSDLVVGDYNFAFDPHSRIRRLFGDEPHRWIVVLDEAHQLVDRARGWLSPEIRLQDAQIARSHAERLDPDGVFAELARDAEDRIAEAIDLAEGPWVDHEAPIEPSPRQWTDLAERFDDVGLEYVARFGLPGDDDPWVALARLVRRFADGLAEPMNGVVTIARRDARAGIRRLCLDPAALVGPMFPPLGGVVLASATLHPARFYQDLLGLDPEKTRVLCGEDPERQPKVLIADAVSTAWKDRARDADATAAILSEGLAEVPGSAAIYFPSFAMLADLVPRIALGDRVPLTQTAAMTDEARAAMLATLSQPGKYALFAVLGGVFAEGIDLPAGALDAVFVCGPALPPVGLERDLLRAWFDERYGAGFRYASLIPGLTRVIQAAGRLHRRPEDRGVIVLVDRRFRWRDVRALLPGDWQIDVPERPALALREWFTPPPAEPA